MQEKILLKILVMGLDNSGKTSITLVRFKKDVNLLNYLSLKPTKGVQISEIKEGYKEIVLWDFGGQEQYRERYMQKMLEYLEEADELIYVVDIQDKVRHREALDYFGDIMRMVKVFGSYPKISLYIHKFDPNIEDVDPTITEELAAKLTKEFMDIAPEHKFDVFKTSIYSFFKCDSFDHEQFL